MAQRRKGGMKPGDTIDMTPGKTTLRTLKQDIMESDENRSIMADVIHAARTAMLMPKVKSDQELMQRLDEYFAMAETRRIPPTVEEMALYVGVTSETLRAWRIGKNRPFGSDATSAIVQKAYEILHSIDAVMAEMNKTNTVSYIFRAKNYYGMVDKQEITVAGQADDKTMSVEQIEEIAAALPDANIQSDATVK